MYARSVSTRVYFCFCRFLLCGNTLCVFETKREEKKTKKKKNLREGIFMQMSSIQSPHVVFAPYLLTHTTIQVSHVCMHCYSRNQTEEFLGYISLFRNECGRKCGTEGTQR